jgi:hypothetical protein
MKKTLCFVVLLIVAGCATLTPGERELIHDVAEAAVTVDQAVNANE